MNIYDMKARVRRLDELAHGLTAEVGRWRVARSVEGFRLSRNAVARSMRTWSLK
jgi:hypothetical protein